MHYYLQPSQSVTGTRMSLLADKSSQSRIIKRFEDYVTNFRQVGHSCPDELRWEADLLKAYEKRVIFGDYFFNLSLSMLLILKNRAMVRTVMKSVAIPKPRLLI